MKPVFSKLTPIFIAGGLCGAMTAMLFGCSRNGGIATVNGEPITSEEFYDYLDTKPTVVVMADGKKVELPAADTLGFQAMQDLVSHKLLVQMAKDEHLEPTDKDVDDDIDFRSKLKPGFITSLKERGLSMAAIRRLVKTELCQFRLQTQGVTVSDADVDKYIADHKDKFVQPAVDEIYWILAHNDEKKAEVDKALASGMSFKAVAKQSSDDSASSQNEGLYPNSIESQLPSIVKDSVSKLGPGQTSEWIKGDQGWAKFNLTKRTDAKPYEMTAERKQYVKQQLMLEKGSQSNDLGKRLAQKLKASETNVTDPALKELWASYEEKLRTTTSDAKAPTTTDQSK